MLKSNNYGISGLWLLFGTGATDKGYDQSV